MSKRHQRQFFYITNREADRPPAGGAFAAAANPGVDTERGGGVMRGEVDREPTTAERQRSFRFSEMVVRNAPENSDELLRALAAVMSPAGLAPPITPADLSGIPAGFTYLGQFLDHDLTKDVTDVPLGTPLAGANAMM